MADSSFDIVSKYDKQEVANAVNTAAKEIANRYDFKNVGASVELSGESIAMRANSEERCLAVLDVVQTWLVKRGVSLKHLDVPEKPRLSGKEYRLDAGLKQGISQEHAKKISKIIRDEGPADGQGADPGRRAAGDEQVARRPPGGPAAPQGRRARGGPAVHELPVIGAMAAAQCLLGHRRPREGSARAAS